MRLKGKQLDAINAALKDGTAEDVNAALQKTCAQVEAIGQPDPKGCSNPRYLGDTFAGGIASMSRHSLAAIELIRRGQWTLDKMERWLNAVISNDPKYFDEIRLEILAKITGAGAEPKDRKDKIEMVLVQSGKFGGIEEEEVQAWRRLCRELNHLIDPEARMPRFNELLHAVWIAASNDQT